jgi:hypothetical protein
VVTTLSVDVLGFTWNRLWVSLVPVFGHGCCWLSLLTVVVGGSRCHLLASSRWYKRYILSSPVLVYPLDFPGLPYRYYASHTITSSRPSPILLTALIFMYQNRCSSSRRLASEIIIRIHRTVGSFKKPISCVEYWWYVVKLWFLIRLFGAQLPPSPKNVPDRGENNRNKINNERHVTRIHQENWFCSVSLVFLKLKLYRRVLL